LFSKKNNMKTVLLSAISFLTIALCVGVTSCKKKVTKFDAPIQGAPGNPRFNLQFTNPETVDLDLHVITPNGEEIYFLNPAADLGQLDVDCLCGDCPSGPNENIFWQIGNAPKGEYKFWVEYYESCDGNDSESEFILRRLNGSNVEESQQGTLSSGKSQVYSFTLN
jgi:uncharacterized protein YfaP (DUF2135 family)